MILVVVVDFIVVVKYFMGFIECVFEVVRYFGNFQGINDEVCG